MTDKLLELKVYCLTLGGIHDFPMLILKDETEVHSLPVCLTPEEATRLAASSMSDGALLDEPIGQQILRLMGLSVDRCVFVKSQGFLHEVDLYLRGAGHHKILRTRADQAMPLLLNSKVRFWAPMSVILDSQSLEIKNRVEQLSNDDRNLMSSQKWLS